MTGRTPTSNKAPLALLLLAAAARAAAAPAPEELLDSALAAPKTPYQGRVMVTQWYGSRTRAEELRVHFAPPDSTRREFLSPDGTVTRVSVSDGETERVKLMAGGKIIDGDAVRSYEKLMPAEREREILLSNYELSVSTDKVAGRAVYTLTLRPRAEGKAWQTLAVDQQTSVLLRVKRFIPRRPFASQAVFTAFEPGKAQDPALFQLEEGKGGETAARGLQPDFLTLEQLGKETGRASRLPQALPGGFVFESADAFKVGRASVAHARYTDGLSVLSIFETDRPVRLPKATAPRSAFPGSLRASIAGRVLSWKAGDRHYTVMGDVSRELLGEIAKALK